MNLALKSSYRSNPDSEPAKTVIPLFIAGIGAVGSTLIKQIRELEHHKFEIRIIGYCNSTNTFWPQNSIVENHAEATNWDQISEKLICSSYQDLVFVDATGSREAALCYEILLANGIRIVTPSKIANTLDQSYFNSLVQLADQNHTKYQYETTVGAGLPVISTLNNLINSGDKVVKVSGVLSGTMTYLFNKIEQGASFSDAILQARELGYSEPDPRDDLSGTDVARKFLIMARTCGYSFEMSDIIIDTLVPEKLINHSLHDFIHEIAEYDGHWKSRNAQALVNNRKLRYVGSFSDEGIRVGVEEVRQDSPLANLQGTDNLVQIYTRRYPTYPIAIQGPGAGKEVTAAGLLGEIVG
ncbi:hypothetical protein AB2B38_005525 [Balneola sp. MJW-20]|uniref:hypothetical protein n=1 Tax=Gracilimonas aurantiaca TaxID=3234185 RepID=UPI003466A249